MVYLADSLALAVLETRVHLEAFVVHQPYVALEYELPDAVEGLDDELPEDWPENVEYTRALGGRWLREGPSPVLRVPSAVVPVECIYLLNPLHPEASNTTLLRRLDYAWDRRIF